MLARQGSSFRALHVLFRALRLPTCPTTHDTGPCGPPSLDVERLPWGFAPSSRCQPAASTHAQGFPSPCFGPSSAFLTPTTVFATTGLAGLFRPATAYRVHPSGDCPPPGARAGFPVRLPSGRCALHAPVLTPGRMQRPRLQGFALQTDAVVADDGEIVGSSAPLLVVLPPPGVLRAHRGSHFGLLPPATFTAMHPPQLVRDVLPMREAAGVAVSCET